MPSITDRSNRARVIFLLGRPGSGKTLATRLIAEHLQFIGFDRLKITIQRDYKVLWEWFLQDKNHLKFEQGPRDGFRVKDFKVLDDCLREINDRALCELETKHVILIEFSRNTYVSAFEYFDSRLLKSSVIVYIYAPIDICLKRNEERTIETDYSNTGYVPPDLIQSYFNEDDIKLLVERFPNNVICIDNRQNGIHLFRDKLLKKVLVDLDIREGLDGMRKL